VRVFGLILLLSAATAAPALAQTSGRFVEPAPVNFERPFLYDGMKAIEPPSPRLEPIPIEEWLANGRKIDGLRERPSPPSMELDAETLQNLFKDDLPRLQDRPAPPRNR